MRHPEFPIVSFLCLPLLLCPLPSHIRARSVSILSLTAWLIVITIIRGVNTLVWANNAVIRLEIWCDISTKITIGFTYAIPMAALCIMCHLERVASTRNVLSTKEDRRRRQWLEATMCFGIPILFMGLHYVVQGHRFDLVEDLGCAPAQYISAAAVVILWVPPLTIAFATMVYAVLVLRHLLRHRISFAVHLRNSQSSMSPNRYLRLMALAVVVTTWDLGTNIYLLYFNVSLSGLRPYTSWNDVHSNFSRVAVFPLHIFPPWLIRQFIIQWWIIPVSCFFFFVFLGFGEEATSDYRAAFMWVRQSILRQNTAPKLHGASPSTGWVSFHRGINVILPSYDAVRYSPKSWDKLSLKMPNSMDRVSSPINAMSTKNFDDVRSSRASDISEGPPLESINISVPVADSTRGSMDDYSVSPRESSIPHAHPDSLRGVSPAPMVIVTNSNSGLPSMMQVSLPAGPVIVSSGSSQASSHRRSMSSDYGITISDAYFANPEIICQGGASDIPGSHSNRRPYPHRGVHMIVEKTMM